MLAWLLMLGLLLLPANRSRDSWAVLLPLVGVCAVAHGLLSLLPSEPADILGQSCNSLALGLTVLWLLPWSSTAQARPRSTFMFFLVLLSVGFLAAVCANGTQFSPGLVGALVLHTLAATSLMSALALSQRQCRRRGDQRLKTRLLLWVVLLNVVLTALCVGLRGPSRLLPALACGAALGLAIYLIAIPFIVLASRSPFYYERLGTWLAAARRQPSSEAVAGNRTPSR